MRHGGRILADQLAIQGAERVFTVPGESFLALLDGLLDVNIENIVCRQEGGAAMMAEAHGKLTGRPGVAIVTRGPGATNSSSGVHVAMHDSTPMLLLVGQVPRGHRDREAFQEVDIARFFQPIAKWTAAIDQTERIPEYISRAYHVAMAGRPGPVVLVLPEDVLHNTAIVRDGLFASPPVQAVAPSTAEAVATRLSESRRPIVIIGGSVWSENASARLAAVSEKFGLPVVASFRRQHYLDNRHRNYVGDMSGGMNPRLAEAIRESDCILALGCRLGDFPTQGYSLPAEPSAARPIIRVHPDPAEPGRVWPIDIAVTANPETFLMALARIDPVDPQPHQDWLQRCRLPLAEWRRPTPLPGKVQFSEILLFLSDHLPEDTILTNGAGNYAAFIHRYFCFKTYGTQVAPTSGSMGYGLPAAVAAKLAFPERTVLCFAGDGCFQMTMNELATAAQHNAAIVAVIANNGIYGTIRMHQEMKFPHRVSGTDLVNPDFAALGRAFGGHGETVTATDEFPAAFRRAAETGRPAVIDLKLDPEAVSTTGTLGELAAAASS